MPAVAHVDNTQAISAVKTGYSKRLRCLSRTHRCSIGGRNEAFLDAESAFDIVHAPSTTHKGDFFTKKLGATAFVAGRERVGLRKP